MTKWENNFRINVGFLINQSVGAYREFEASAPFLQIEDSERFENVQSIIRFSRVQQGILTSVKASAEVTAECVRCLITFPQKVTCSFDELYAFHLRQNVDADAYLPESGFIDLAPILIEFLTLEVPISPICSTDCKGLCIECGKNLNQGPCEHMQQTVREHE